MLCCLIFIVFWHFLTGLLDYFDVVKEQILERLYLLLNYLILTHLLSRGLFRALVVGIRYSTQNR
jgi:hypothetical protein